MAKVISAPHESLSGLQPSVLHLRTPHRPSLRGSSHEMTLEETNRVEKSPRCASRTQERHDHSSNARRISRSITVPGLRLAPTVTGQSRVHSPVHGLKSLSDSSLAKSWPRTVSPHIRLNPLEIECKVLAAVEKHYSQVTQACQIVDCEKQSQIRLNDFRRVIETFCFPLTDEQFEHFSMKLPKAANNTVDYKRFLEEVRPTLAQGDIRKHIASHYRRPDSRDDKFEEVENRLRSKISSQLQSVLKALRLFDYNRDGQIQRHDLKRILEHFCFRMTDSFFDRIWQRSDVPVHSNLVNYFDFLRRIGVDVMGRGYAPENDTRGSQSPSPIQSKKQKMKSGALHGLTISQIEKKFRQAMIDQYEDIKRAFVAFDKRQDGFVTLEQLKRILSSFIFPVSDTLFAELMGRCGVKASHKISYDHFLEKFQHQGPQGNGQTIPIKQSHKVNPIREAESTLTVDDIWQRLENHVAGSFASIKEAFLAFDDDKDGFIKRKDLRKVLESFCFRITQDQVREIMNRLDSKQRGFVTFHEFLDHFEVREGKGAHPWLSGDRKQNVSRHPGVMAWTMVEEVLRDKLSDNWRTIAKAFTKVDDDKDGTISKDELKKLLQQYALPISEEHFRFLWDRCDENRDGKIEFGEFFRKLGVNMAGSDITGFSTRITDESEAKITMMRSDQRQRLEQNSKVANARTSKMTADNVIGLLKEHISQKSADLRKTFLSFDSDGDGKLSKKEFRMVLGNLGMFLSDDQFRELTSRLDFYRGCLSYHDFLTTFSLPERGSKSGSSLHFSNHRYNKVIERQDAMPAADVEMILKKKITEGFQDLRQAFYKVDEDHDGIISIAEFRRLLVNFMIPMDDKNFTELLQRLGISSQKPIDYHKFLQQFQSREDVHKGHPWLFTENKFGVTLEMKDQTAEQAHELLKVKAADQWYDISTAYRRFDRDGNGIVTKKELKAILHRFNIPISKEEFKKLWTLYDTDKNNCIDHREFLSKLGVEFAPGDVQGLSAAITKGSEEEIIRHHQSQKAKQQRATENQVNVASYLSAMEVETRLRDLFRDSFPGFRKAFERVDTNQDGYISTAELLKVLHSYHLFMKETELSILLNRIGLRSDDRLPYAQFLAAFEDPRSSGNTKISLDVPLKAPASVTFETAKNMSNDEMIHRIRNKVAANAGSMKQAFKAFDAAGLGRVSKEDLHQVINSFCCQISQKQFKVLLDKIHVLPDGTIDYNLFTEAFTKSDTEMNRSWLEGMLNKDKLEIRPRKKSKSPEPTDELETELTELIKQNYHCLEKACEDHDPQDLGKISSSSLHLILQENGFDVLYGNLSRLLQKLNLKDDADKVPYGSFFKYFLSSLSPRNGRSRSPSPYRQNKNMEPSGGKSPVSGRKSPVPSGSFERIERLSLSPPETASDVERRIYPKMTKLWPKLTAAFKRNDVDQSGLVSKKDFQDVLQQYNISVNDRDVDLLWKKYEGNNQGRIQYGSFLKRFAIVSKSLDESILNQRKPKLLSGNPNIKSEAALSVLRRIQGDVTNNWKGMRRAFRLEDKRGDGTCSFTVFGQLLRKFKIDISQEDLYHLSAEFDNNLSGKVAYNDFLRCFFI